MLVHCKAEALLKPGKGSFKETQLTSGARACARACVCVTRLGAMPVLFRNVSVVLDAHFHGCTLLFVRKCKSFVNGNFRLQVLLS